MADTGGGEDWSLQYSLAASISASDSKALLSPPFADKKAAIALPAGAIHSTRIFIAAIINEQGEVQDLRSPRELDDAARSAIQSLTKWRFSPALLSGKPVAVKVLIGVVPRLIPSR
jgi:hypothetical protein